MNGLLRVKYKPDTNALTANRITVREIETVKEIVTPKTLLKMLELEFNDHTPSKFHDERAYSQEDQKFLDRQNMVSRKVKVTMKSCFPSVIPTSRSPITESKLSREPPTGNSA